MPDYIYLLENRLSSDQRNALHQLREAAREAEMILFLTGDAVRDLTSGHAVRDIEVAVQGNAVKLKKTLEKTGAKIWGEDEASRSLYLCFPGTVRVDLVSTHRVEYKKPGQPTYHWDTIQDDLRRRDFTANAMAISLNEGSFGLLMDPLNGVADIEARTLRLVSNYGFIEDPSLMIRAVRYKVRLGWELDPRTQTRYENAKSEDVIQYLSPIARARELEQIGHEDEGLKVLQALETEGWMQHLCPQWTSTKADVDKLHALHDLSVELLMQGVHADISAAQMQLLTAKLAPKDLAGLKKSLLRPGFVEEWNSLDQLAAGFAKVLLAKENAAPSATFKLFTSYDPEAVLWLGFTSKDSAVKDRYNKFLKVWPGVRQQLPYALMQEMRIRPELPNYNEILQLVFLEMIDGKLTTPEEMKAFLEPYSPPAPPPQVTIKRSRGRRAEKKVFDEDEEAASTDEDLDDMGGDEDDIGLGKLDLESDEEESEDHGEVAEEEEAEDEEEAAPSAKRGKAAPAPKSAPKPAATPVPAPKPAAAAKAPSKPEAPAKAAAPVKHVEPAKPAAKHPPAPAKPAAKPVPAKAAKHAPAKPAPAAKPKHPAPAHKPAAAHKAAPAHKPVAKPAPKAPVKKAALKPPTKPAHKSVPKAPAKSAKAAVTKPAAKKAIAKPASKAKPHKPAKPAPKKVVAKPSKKH